MNNALEIANGKELAKKAHKWISNNLDPEMPVGDITLSHLKNMFTAIAGKGQSFQEFLGCVEREVRPKRIHQTDPLIELSSDQLDMLSNIRRIARKLTVTELRHAFTFISHLKKQEFNIRPLNEMRYCLELMVAQSANILITAPTGKIVETLNSLKPGLVDPIAFSKCCSKGRDYKTKLNGMKCQISVSEINTDNIGMGYDENVMKMVCLSFDTPEEGEEARIELTESVKGLPEIAILSRDVLLESKLKENGI